MIKNNLFYKSNTKKIGFLCAFDTCKTKLHKTYLGETDKYEFVYPNEEGKNNLYEAVHSLEYGIKTLSNPITRKAKRIFKEEIDNFIDNGIECIVLCCSEIYLAFTSELYYKNILFIDMKSDIVIN